MTVNGVILHAKVGVHCVPELDTGWSFVHALNY